MLLLATLLAPVQAAPTAGIPLTIAVVDDAGKPVSSAQIRHPKEISTHRVNIEDGTWTSDAVTLATGDELIFAKKMVVPFIVTAPGFQNQSVSFVIKKKDNVFKVELAPLDLTAETPEDGPSIHFKHDKPRD